MPTRFVMGAAVLAAAAMTAPSMGAFVYAESISGDLSNDPMAPTSIPLGFGTNFVQFVTSVGDREFFTVTIPAGGALVALDLAEYESDDPVAFGAFMPGAIFNDDPDSPNPAVYSGLALFGTGDLGQDLLPAFQDSLGFASLGFSVPLGPGDYTFWVQQVGPVTGITLDFIIVPTPGAAGVLALSGLVAMRRRRG